MYNAFFVLKLLGGLTGGAVGTCGTPPGAVLASFFASSCRGLDRQRVPWCCSG